MKKRKSLRGAEKAVQASANTQSSGSIGNEVHQLPYLSVVMPVRNEELFIEQTLTQLAAQDYPQDRFEIRVVDGMSTDNTKARVKEFQRNHPDINIELHENPRRLSSAARNIGVRNAKGDYILIVDGHVHIPSNRLLRDSAELIWKYEPRVLGRPQHLDPPGIDLFQQSVALVRSTPIGHSPESEIYSRETKFVSPISVAVMYHRSVFEQIGEFDESFDAAEDYEFNYRLEASGERCLISPKLEILYYPRGNLKSLFMQMQRYGLGRARFLKKHAQRWTVNTVIPSLFLLACLILAVASFVRSEFFLLGIALAVLYALVVTLACSREKGFRWQRVPTYTLIALAIHLALGWGFLHGLLRRRASD